MPLEVGQPAPPLPALDARGEPVVLPPASPAPAAVVFLRYLGCPYCQLAISRLRSDAPRWRALGAEVWVLLQSRPDRLAAWVAETSPPFRVIADPAATAYDAWRVPVDRAFLGTARAMATPGGLLQAARAAARGHGRFEGRERQCPADFVVGADGRLAWVRLGRGVQDDYRSADLEAAVAWAATGARTP